MYDNNATASTLYEEQKENGSVRARVRLIRWHDHRTDVRVLEYCAWNNTGYRVDYEAIETEKVLLRHTTDVDAIRHAIEVIDALLTIHQEDTTDE